MNVILTTPWLTREGGGMARSVPALSSALARLGLHVDLLALQLGEQRESHIFPDSELVNTILSPCIQFKKLRLFWSSQFARSLRSRAESSRPVIIHDHGLWQPTNFSAAQTARHLGIPYIISPHGTVSPWALSHRWWKKWIAWRCYVERDLQTAQVLHATSPEEAQHLRNLGLRQPIAVIPNGVDVPENLVRPQRNTNQKTALYLGRIHRSKGLLNLVQAWATVRPHNWKIILAGPDEENHRAEVEAAIRENQLTDVFQFTGAVEGQRKWDLYRQADLFILPTFTENFGLSVAEALAAGVPVITTHGAPWEDLQTYQCGWWIEIGPAPLAEALREATSITEDTRTAMGQRGRELVQEKFLWPKVAGEMSALYQWVLGLGARPQSVMLN